jgi:molybdopterin-containing oxidoreductase family iron-sulfur binding subunit
MKKENTKAHKFGMVIDLDKCTGCGSCMVSCMSENNVPFKEDESKKKDSINWINVYKITNGKAFPDIEIAYIPRPCQHCGGIGDHGHSPCVSVCPATATDYGYDTGIVSQIYTRCFGCRYCMGACPYHARYFNWWDPKWPTGMEKYLNPDVSPRMRGVVEKCSFCYHRYQAARDMAYYEGRKDDIAEEEYQTACTSACPARAIVFGDLNNPDHLVHQIVQPDPHPDPRNHRVVGKSRNPEIFRLLERLGTNPKVYYLSKREWVRKAGDNYLPGEWEKLKINPTGSHGHD